MTKNLHLGIFAGDPAPPKAIGLRKPLDFLAPMVEAGRS
jgi:hypothetical protein